MTRVRRALPGDEYIVTSGALKGQRGVFTRDDSGPRGPGLVGG